MSKYYEAKVRVSREIEDEKGNYKIKRQVLSYIINCESISIAEAKIHKEYEHCVDDFEVISIKETNIHSILQ